MSVFYKSTDNQHHKIDSRYKTMDSRWHYIKNVFYKSTDSRWHPAYTYQWVPGSWGTCSKSCGGGTQTRTVTCYRNDGIIRPDIFCNGITKPPLSQACNTHGCVVCVQSPGNCNYCWSSAQITASKIALPDSSITQTDLQNGGNFYIVGNFNTRQWSAGNNWGCGRCHAMAEVGYGMVNGNHWNGPPKGWVNGINYWVHFSQRYLTPEQLNGFNFQVIVRVRQCHWDGGREVCLNSAVITKDLSRYNTYTGTVTEHKYEDYYSGYSSTTYTYVGLPRGLCLNSRQWNSTPFSLF